MKRLVIMLTLCGLGIGSPIQGQSPSLSALPVELPAPDYLFLLDTSFSMARQRLALTNALAWLILSGVEGQIRPGQTISVCTFNDTVHPRRLSVEPWNPDQSGALAQRAVQLVKNQRFEKQTRLEVAIGEMLRAIQTAPTLTIFLFSDGDERISNTPFDRTLNRIYQERSPASRRARKPIITTFVARAGRLTDWTVAMAGEPIIIPGAAPRAVSGDASQVSSSPFAISTHSAPPPESLAPATASLAKSLETLSPTHGISPPLSPSPLLSPAVTIPTTSSAPTPSPPESNPTAIPSRATVNAEPPSRPTPEPASSVPLTRATADSAPTVEHSLKLESRARSEEKNPDEIPPGSTRLALPAAPISDASDESPRKSVADSLPQSNLSAPAAESPAVEPGLAVTAPLDPNSFPLLAALGLLLLGVGVLYRHFRGTRPKIQRSLISQSLDRPGNNRHG